MEKIKIQMDIKDKANEVALFFFFGLFASSRAAPSAYESSQAGGLMGAVATGLRHSRSSAGSTPRLRPTPQLTAMPDP